MTRSPVRSPSTAQRDLAGFAPFYGARLRMLSELRVVAPGRHTAHVRPGLRFRVSTAKLRSPLVAKWKSPLSAGCSVGQGLTSVAGSGLAHAVGLAGGDHGGGVVQEPVQEADGGRVFGQEPSPVLEAPV